MSYLEKATRTNSSTAVLLVAIGLAALAGCKRDEASSGQKTLDNFAAGKTVRVNECKGTSKVIFPEDRIRFSGVEFASSLSKADRDRAEGPYRAAVREYMSSLPEDMQRAFLNFGGSVLISDKAGELCGKPFSDPSSSQYTASARADLESCFIYARGGEGTMDQNQAIFTIVHKPDARAIRHGGVRVFGFLYAQFFPRLAKSPEGSSAAPYTFNNDAMQDESGFRPYKRRLATSFLTDVVDKGIYDLANLEPLLGSGAGAVIRRNISADSSADPLADVSWLRPGETSLTSAEIDVRRDRFMDFVFAEAFDSMRCSEASVAVMKSEFPKTHREFLAVDQAILALSKILAESATPQSGASGNTGLALAGGSREAKGPANLAGGSSPLSEILAMLLPALGGLKPGAAPIGQIGPAGGSKFGSSGGMFGSMFGQLKQSGCPGGVCQVDGGGCAGGCCGGSGGGGCTNCSGGCYCG